MDPQLTPQPPVSPQPPMTPLQPPPITPAPSRFPIVPTLIALLIAVALAGGAYMAWSNGLLGGIAPAPAQEEVSTEPQPTETSDIEAELDSVEVGSDAEVDSLEAQF